MVTKRFVLFVVAAAVVAAGAAQAAEAPTGFRAEFLRQLDDVGKKLVDLANAVPAEKYSWRPAEGVRSVSEVFVHVAAGNYGIMRATGMQPPAGLDMRSLEKTVTEKAKVVEFVKESFDRTRQFVQNMPDGDLEKQVKFFGGRETPIRNVLFFLAQHEHEHLGQSIAYARMNGVVPPWSRKGGE
ncbi:MAG: DinB family protein [Acidobacteria bacterium]|nr:DinB family protein [Acidobacteriota bacterium]